MASIWTTSFNSPLLQWLLGVVPPIDEGDDPEIFTIGRGPAPPPVFQQPSSSPFDEPEVPSPFDEDGVFRGYDGRLMTTSSFLDLNVDNRSMGNDRSFTFTVLDRNGRVSRLQDIRPPPIDPARGVKRALAISDQVNPIGVPSPPPMSPEVREGMSQLFSGMKIMNCTISPPQQRTPARCAAAAGPVGPDVDGGASSTPARGESMASSSTADPPPVVEPIRHHCMRCHDPLLGSVFLVLYSKDWQGRLWGGCIDCVLRNKPVTAFTEDDEQVDATPILDLSLMALVKKAGARGTPEFEMKVFKKEVQRRWQARLAGNIVNRKATRILTFQHVEAVLDEQGRLEGLSKTKQSKLILEQIGLWKPRISYAISLATDLQKKQYKEAFSKWELEREKMSYNAEYVPQLHPMTEHVDLLSEILPCLDRFYLCRRQSCLLIGPAGEWYQAGETNVFACPGCGTRYYPFAGGQLGGQAPVPAQFAIIFSEPPKQGSTGIASDAAFNGEYNVLLTEWPETAEENLITELKIATAGLDPRCKAVAQEVIVGLANQPKHYWMSKPRNQFEAFNKLQWDNIGRKKKWRHPLGEDALIHYTRAEYIEGTTPILKPDQLLALFGFVNGEGKSSRQ